MNSENYLAEMVNSIADDLEKVARNEFYEEDSEERQNYSSDVDAYFSDAYDIEIRSGIHGEYRSVRVMLAGGGPSVYYDSKTACVIGYWWSTQFDSSVSNYANSAIDQYFEEIWNCR